MRSMIYPTLLSLSLSLLLLLNLLTPSLAQSNGTTTLNSEANFLSLSLTLTPRGYNFHNNPIRFPGYDQPFPNLHHHHHLDISPAAAILQTRGLQCECFDPDETCCIPPSPSLAPFCVSKNATCCGNTWCQPDEICCDDGEGRKGCCPSNAVCSASGKGCCPKGEICLGPFTCHNYTSPLCGDDNNNNNKNIVDAFLCCPTHLPLCLNIPTYGLGCFASSPAPAPLFPPPATSSSSIPNTGPITRSYSISTTILSTSTSTTTTTVLLSKKPKPEHTSVLSIAKSTSTSMSTSQQGAEEASLCWNDAFAALMMCPHSTIVSSTVAGLLHPTSTTGDLNSGVGAGATELSGTGLKTGASATASPTETSGGVSHAAAMRGGGPGAWWKKVTAMASVIVFVFGFV